MGFASSPEKKKYRGIIEAEGGKEKIKAFEREIKPYWGRQMNVEQRNGEKTTLYAWELFLLDRDIITFPEDEYTYRVISPSRLTEYIELRKGLQDLNERREYMRNKEKAYAKE